MVPNRVVPGICKKFSDGNLQTLSHYPLSTVEHLVRGYRSHAAMIDGAVAQHAGRALRRVANNLPGGPKRARGEWISRPEDYESRRTHRGHNVRRPRVVRDQDIGDADEGDDF